MGDLPELLRAAAQPPSQSVDPTRVRRHAQQLRNRRWATGFAATSVAAILLVGSALPPDVTDQEVRTEVAEAPTVTPRASATAAPTPTPPRPSRTQQPDKRPRRQPRRVPAGESPRNGRGPKIEASCVTTLQFAGRDYHVLTTVRARPTRSLGTGKFAGCGDTSNVRVAAVRGVTPSQAVAVLSEERPTVYVAEGLGRLPAGLRKMAGPPRCVSNRPFRLAGAWLGIEGFSDDGGDAYTLEVRVTAASRAEAMYRDAVLTLTVPADALDGVTRRDIRRSLWTGGNIVLDVVCRGAAHLVTDVVAAVPPSGDQDE